MVSANSSTKRLKLSDITGTTDLVIIHAIVAGEPHGGPLA